MQFWLHLEDAGRRILPSNVHSDRLLLDELTSHPASLLGGFFFERLNSRPLGAVGKYVARSG